MINGSFYDKDVPPMEGDELLLINITLNSFRLLDMDEVEETIQYQNEFLMMWFDPTLGWDRRLFPDYDSEYVMVPEDQLWIPDVIYYSTIDSEPILTPKDSLVMIRYDGWVRVSVPATITVPCTLRLQDFPYDEQHCNITLGSWIFTEEQITVVPNEQKIVPTPQSNIGQLPSIEYTGNSEWQLLSIDVSQIVEDISGDGNYSLILYEVRLKRKPVYYVMVIQTPTLIIGTVTIFGMFTPHSQRMERWQTVELGLNMLLAITMMLNLVSSYMPKTSRLPLLGNYIIAEIFICSIGIVVSMVLLEIHSRAAQRNWQPPDWLIKIVLFAWGSKKFAVSSDPPRDRPPSHQELSEKDDIYRLNVVKGQLTQTLHLVRGYMNREHVEREWLLLWTRIFDRIDLVLLVVFQAANIDQQQETIHFFNEIVLLWNDPRLAWDPAQFEDSDIVKVRHDYIWIPDLIYDNTIDSVNLVPEQIASADLEYDGTVRMSLAKTITSLCELKFEDFPYDKQKCELPLGSWYFSQISLRANKDVLEPDKGVLAGENSGGIAYYGNAEWSLLEIRVVPKFVPWDWKGTTLKYSQVVYQINLKRKPVYYVMVIQTPTLIIGLLTVLGIFTPFSQRRERTQRAELGLGMLLAISMLLNLLSEMMPKIEKLPLLGNYIVAEIFICAIATIISITLFEIHARADQRNWRPPDLLCQIVLLSCRQRKLRKISAQVDPQRIGAPIDHIRIMNGSHDAYKAQKQMTQTLHLVKQYIERDRVEDEWKLLWIRIFDRVDIVFLILFQAANIVAAVMFMR
ncbi:unnamed protein product, partial [Mesorhabditis spiculigera]